ncbi:MAG: UDP-2,3-diacylglucosamine diphosphatase [Gammaproteobacteria bacterium]|nr:UDP-2,3-diacylglucosamine diphosphatase [Gammaproteobacteria bacterium]
MSIPADNPHRLVLGTGERAIFISDLHLGPAHPEIETRFARFLDRVRDECDALFILGDLFEYWIGDDAAGRLGHDRAIDLLGRFIERSGCRGYMMHGNRDFLVGEDFARRTGLSLLPDPCLVECGGTPVLLSHGDALCTDDTEHRAFRRMVREPAWHAEFPALGIDQRLERAREARERSESGKSRKAAYIMDVNERAVADLMLRFDVRFLIHGHTHRPAIHRLDLDGKTGWRIVLGDWYDGTSDLVIADGAVHYAPDGKARELPLL